MLRTLLFCVTPLPDEETTNEDKIETPKNFETVKKELLTRVSQSNPDVFEDSFQFDILKDPVIMEESGHVYERKEIEFWVKRNHSSPRTQKPCALSDLKEVPELKKIIDQFKQEKEDILSKILSTATIMDLEALEPDVKAYFLNVDKHVEQFKTVCVDFQIRYIKNRDFLDINDSFHLAYWHEFEEKACDRVEVAHGIEKFYIHRKNYDKLIAANQKYKSVEAFNAALSNAEKQYRNGYFNFLSLYCLGPRKHTVTLPPESKNVSPS